MNRIRCNSEYLPFPVLPLLIVKFSMDQSPIPDALQSAAMNELGERTFLGWKYRDLIFTHPLSGLYAHFSPSLGVCVQTPRANLLFRGCFIRIFEIDWAQCSADMNDKLQSYHGDYLFFVERFYSLMKLPPSSLTTPEYGDENFLSFTTDHVLLTFIRKDSSGFSYSVESTLRCSGELNTYDGGYSNLFDLDDPLHHPERVSIPVSCIRQWEYASLSEDDIVPKNSVSNDFCEEVKWYAKFRNLSEQYGNVPVYTIPIICSLDAFLSSKHGKPLMRCTVRCAAVPCKEANSAVHVMTQSLYECGDDKKGERGFVDLFSQILEQLEPEFISAEPIRRNETGIIFFDILRFVLDGPASSDACDTSCKACWLCKDYPTDSSRFGAQLLYDDKWKVRHDACSGCVMEALDTAWNLRSFNEDRLSCPLLRINRSSFSPDYILHDFLLGIVKYIFKSVQKHVQEGKDSDKVFNRMRLFIHKMTESVPGCRSLSHSLKESPGVLYGGELLTLSMTLEDALRDSSCFDSTYSLLSEMMICAKYITSISFCSALSWTSLTCLSLTVNQFKRLLSTRIMNFDSVKIHRLSHLVHFCITTGSPMFVSTFASEFLNRVLRRVLTCNTFGYNCKQALDKMLKLDMLLSVLRGVPFLNQENKWVCVGEEIIRRGLKSTYYQKLLQFRKISFYAVRDTERQNVGDEWIRCSRYHPISTAILQNIIQSTNLRNNSNLLALSKFKNWCCFESISIRKRSSCRFRVLDSISTKHTGEHAVLQCIVGIIRCYNTVGKEEKVSQRTYILLRQWEHPNSHQRIWSPGSRFMILGSECFCMDISVLYRSHVIFSDIMDVRSNRLESPNVRIPCFANGFISGTVNPFVLNNPFRHEFDSPSDLLLDWNGSEMNRVPWIRALDCESSRRNEFISIIYDRLTSRTFAACSVNEVVQNCFLFIPVRSVSKPFFVEHLEVRYVHVLGEPNSSNRFSCSIQPPIFAAFLKQGLSAAETRRRASTDALHVVDAVRQMLDWMFGKAGLGPICVVSPKGRNDFKSLLREIALDSGFQEKSISIRSIFCIPSSEICCVRNLQRNINNGGVF